jgi:hypothetical protein
MTARPLPDQAVEILRARGDPARRNLPLDRASQKAVNPGRPLGSVLVVCPGRAMGIRIIPLEPSDWPSVRSIYDEGIASGRATFETEAPSWETWNDAHLAAPRLKAVEDSRIAGWAA